MQGNGGLVTSLPVLLAQQRLAREGRPLGIYEPEPGCVCVFPDFNAHDNGRRVIVPIKSAIIVRVPDPELAAKASLRRIAAIRKCPA